MHLQIIVGSIREGRVALPVATWVEQIAAAHGPWTTEVVDLKAWALPMLDFAKPPAMGAYQDELQLRWAKTISNGDAYIFVAPEYNHGYSAVLKNALDYLFAEWRRKPANFVSYGNAEGARGIEQLRLVLVELQMAPLASALHLRDAHSKLKQAKFEGDADDKRRLTRGLDDLHWWASALRAAREHSSPDLVGRKVLVIGVSEEVNRSVTQSLRDIGIAAQGCADPDRATEMFDAKNFELIAFGRATAGPAAEAIKSKFKAQRSDVTFLDVIAPFAQRQVVAALKNGSRARFARDLRVSNNASGANIVVQMLAPSHVTLTLFQKHTDGLTSKTLTELDAEAGPLEWPLNSADMAGAFSIVLDANGEEFLHYAFL